MSVRLLTSEWVFPRPRRRSVGMSAIWGVLPNVVRRLCEPIWFISRSDPGQFVGRALDQKYCFWSPPSARQNLADEVEEVEEIRCGGESWGWDVAKNLPWCELKRSACLPGQLCENSVNLFLQIGSNYDCVVLFWFSFMQLLLFLQCPVMTLL